MSAIFNGIGFGVGSGMGSLNASMNASTNASMSASMSASAKVSADSSTPVFAGSAQSGQTSNTTAANVGISPGQTLLQQLNHKLYPQGLQAVFQYDNKAHMTWLNVVNKATGQVVDRYPPEKIREMVDAAASVGLSYDKRL